MATTSYAFVTLVTSDTYLPGALTLAAALRDLHPSPPTPPQVPFHTACLVTPESVDVSSIKLLRNAFDLVVGVELITQHDQEGLKLLGRLDLNTVLTKLHVFRLTQFSKIIFLDADVLPVRPLSHLFTIPHEFSAVPDVGWPDIFNSGVMVLSPGEDKFSELDHLFKSKGSWDGGDQGLLNEWRAGNWNRLSFIYNTTPTAAYTYAPAYERFGSQISAIHFIGPDKPWSSISHRVPFSNQSTSDSSQQAYDYNALVDRWYATYDKHYRIQDARPPTQFEVTPYIPAWRETSVGDRPSSFTPTRTLGLDELRRLAIEGMNASSHSSHRDNFRFPLFGNGEYRSMPLEGRLDLMRPRTDKSAIREDISNGKDSKRPQMLYGSAGDEVPHMPLADQINVPLPTRQLSEIPSSPRPRTIALPSVTPTPRFGPPHYLRSSDPESPSVHEHVAGFQHRKVAQEGQEHNNFPHSTAHPQREPDIHPENPSTPPRPHSPTMLIWNAALEPPPTSAPPNSAFPSQAYFPNIWDVTASRKSDQPHLLRSQQPSSGALFEPPPQPEIPESLVKQGHYRNVTGEDELGAIRSPDRTKVKHVFPWEEKPRHPPGRVFPATDSPKPSLFLSPESQTSSSEMPTTPDSKSSHLLPALSPLSGFPATFNYPNTWDTIPSIQKYAEKLAQPPTPKSLAPAFEDQKWSKRRSRSREESAEVSSRDGDVEDEGDDTADEEVPLNGSCDDDGDTEFATSVQRQVKHTSSTERISMAKKQYRDVGVQTDSREMQTQGVQTVTPPTEKFTEKDSQKVRRPTMSGKRWWAPSTRHDVPPLVTLTHDIDITPNQQSAAAVTDIRPHLGKQAAPSPPLRSPISPSLFPRGRHTSNLAPPNSTTFRPPHSPSLHSPPTISSQTSNSSSLESPRSSIGLPSPSESLSNSPRARKAGRVWDPARGVELVKRGSEEVLARFLRMGSREDEHY